MGPGAYRISVLNAGHYGVERARRCSWQRRQTDGIEQPTLIAPLIAGNVSTLRLIAQRYPGLGALVAADPSRSSLCRATAPMVQCWSQRRALDNSGVHGAVAIALLSMPSNPVAADPAHLSMFGRTLHPVRVPPATARPSGFGTARP